MGCEERIGTCRQEESESGRFEEKKNKIEMVCTTTVDLVIAFIVVTSASAQLAHSFQNEMEVPVLLWDEFNNPVTEPNSTSENDSAWIPPRYLAGMMGVVSSPFSKLSMLPPFFRTAATHTKKQRRLLRDGSAEGLSPIMNYFTFDLGNPEASILTVQDCLGCSPLLPSNETNQSPCDLDGCPGVFPSCENLTSSFCWISRPDQFIPSWSFNYLSNNEVRSCPKGIHSAGSMEDPQHPGSNATVCTQCFGDRNHSRFFSFAESSNLVILGKKTNSSGDDEVVSVKRLPDNFLFGALTRTVPLMDRMWSNVGIGFNSSFLSQLNVSSLMLRLGSDFNTTGVTSTTFDNDDAGRGKVNHKSVIIFNPDPVRYINEGKVPMQVMYDRRTHDVSYLDFGSFRIKGDYPSSTTRATARFHIDTGNPGISLKDSNIMQCLGNLTGGSWLMDNSTEPNLFRLYVPKNYSIQNMPDLTIAMTAKEVDEDVRVTIPGTRLLITPPLSSHPLNPHINPAAGNIDEDYRSQSRSLFPSVHVGQDNDAFTGLRPTMFIGPYPKNVFGLPFLSIQGVDFVFDDALHNFHIVKSPSLKQNERSKLLDGELPSFC